jgi:hypothetical protein
LALLLVDMLVLLVVVLVLLVVALLVVALLVPLHLKVYLHKSKCHYYFRYRCIFD